MWSKFFGGIKQVFDLFEELRRLREGQDQLKRQLEEQRDEQARTVALVRDMMHELVHLRDHDTHEREKLVLRLENELLKFERRLPPKPQ